MTEHPTPSLVERLEELAELAESGALPFGGKEAVLVSTADLRSAIALIACLEAFYRSAGKLADAARTTITIGGRDEVLCAAADEVECLCEAHRAMEKT